MVILEINLIRNYKEFSYIRKSLQWFNENEDFEEVVVQKIVEQRQRTTEVLGNC
jgi:hypothetical protein